MFSLKAIADHLRAAPKNKSVDRYNILSPLLATGDYITSTKEAFTLLRTSPYVAVLTGRDKTTNKNVEKAVFAYKDYVKNLSSQEQTLEKAQPFASILLALESIAGNITAIEDNFQNLFGSVSTEAPETSLRSSSLVVIGYLEQANAFATWLGSLIEHMSAEVGDMIPPFHSKELLTKAAIMADFAVFNLHKWNYKTGGLLNDLKDMQRKGSDLTLQTKDGDWIDQFAHDSQFTPMEQELMTASMRSPIMIALTWSHVRLQDKIELLTSQKDWLTSKIILEQSKLRGMDPESPEYKRLKKATDRYSSMVSKYEQKIERMRA